MRQNFLSSKNVEEIFKLGQFTSNSDDNTYLRGILKKK